MDDIEATDVLLTVSDDTSTTHVTSTSDDHDIASVKLDEISNLALLEVETNSVFDLDQRIGVTDGATVMGNNVGDTLVADGDLADLEELVGGFLRGDAVDGETTLDVVKQTEVLAGLLDGHNV